MNRPFLQVVDRKLWIFLFCAITLVVAAGGALFFHREHDRARSAGYAQVASISQLKASQIERWRSERLFDARVAAGSPIVSKVIQTWLENPVSQPDLQAELETWLKMEKSGDLYSDVLLLDAKGRVLLSSTSQPQGSSAETLMSIRQAATAGKEALSDLYLGTDGSIYLDAVAPIMGDHGRMLGLVDLRANARNDLFTLIQSWPTPSPSAEILMVRSEGSSVLFLNDLRDGTRTGLSLRVPLSRTEVLAVQAAHGKRGLVEGRDHRGVSVLADLRSITGSPWLIVSKVDATEIYREANLRGVLIPLTVGLSVFLAGGGLIYRRAQALYYLNLFQAERKERELALEFRTTLYSIGDAVISTDADGVVGHMNPEAQRLTGWKETEARGKPLSEVFRIIDEKTRVEIESPVHRILREGSVVGIANRTVLLARDGAEWPVLSMVDSKDLSDSPL